MLKPAISLAISAALFAGVAFAQPATAPAAGPPLTSSATAPAPAKAPATGGKTVDGVTVTGKAFPKTECSSRDQACIRTVVAELKRLYPEQLKRFCFQRQMRAMRETALFGDADPGGTEPTQTGVTFSTAAPLAVACASDKK